MIQTAYETKGTAQRDSTQGAIMEAASNPGEKILVIEDDRAVQKALRRLFEGEGFAVDVAGNGTEGLQMFQASAPAVLVLDLSLPGTPGQDICRAISQAAPALPIIILSARAEVVDKVLLLELGAHDYVTKPFSPRELLARVRTAMRRRAVAAPVRVPDAFSFGDVNVDFCKMELRRGGELVSMTSAGIQGAEVYDSERGARAFARGIAESGVGLQELSEHQNRRQSHFAAAAKTGKGQRKSGAFSNRAQRRV